MGAALTRQRLVTVTSGVCILLGLVVGGKYIVSFHLEKKRRQLAISRMKLVGHVTNIQIYPIKSCRPIAVKEADCYSLGLYQGPMRDRVFVITDDKHHFITARNDPLLLSIQPSYHGNELWLDAPEVETFKLPIPRDDKKLIRVRIWGQNCKGIDCGDEVAQWLTAVLKRSPKKTRLVYHPWDVSERIPEEWYNWELFGKKDSTIFGDLCPFLLINEASVEDLNSRLAGKKITAQHFRPSITIDGSKPFEEDDWRYVKIGDSSLFRCLRPCSRCILTTVDPETGIRSPDGEPLTTLRRYRAATGSMTKKIKKESPMFGIYIGLDVKGTVKVGDPIYASA